MFDYWYLILVVPAAIFAVIAQIRVKTAYSKYSKVPTSRGITGYEAARRILSANGINNVQIERTAGQLTDHYDPKANVIRLSEGVYGSTSVAAVGIASHEAGHAVQHSVGYAPVKLRTAIIPVCNIGSNLAMPLVIIGLIFSYYPIAMAGVILFGLAVVFQLVTLPVEFNASRRAMEALEASGTMDGEELKGSRKVLTAAALTYVAALAVALANFLRLLLLVSGGGRRRK